MLKEEADANNEDSVVAFADVLAWLINGDGATRIGVGAMVEFAIVAVALCVALFSFI